MKPEGRPALRAPTAHLVAWLVVAGLDALVVLLTPLEAAAATWVVALPFFYDVGHCLAAGILSAAVVGAASRVPGLPRWARGGIVFALAALVGAVTLPPDLEMRAAKLVPPGLLQIGIAAMLAVVAAAIPMAAAVGRAASGRPLLRLAAGAVAVAVAFGNHLVLARNYPGIHLFVAWASAVLLGASLGPGLGRSDEVPRRAAPGTRARAITALAVLASAWGAFAVATRPPDAVLARMLHWPGLVFAPFLGQVHARAAFAGTARGDGPFWRSRGEASEVPATGAALSVLGTEAPIVLFLTVDCLRADLLEKEENRSRLPTLFALRDRGARFTAARTVAPATVVALTSIFTGKLFSQLYWSQHPAMGQAFAHEDRSTRFPEVLASAGVETVSVRSIDFLAPDGGVAVGFTRDVDVERAPGLVFAPAARMVEGLLGQLDPPPGKPTFLFAHLLDAHAPYDLAGSEGTLRERYEREVMLVDEALATLMRRLEAPELASRTVLILSADHGEAFGEHLAEYHGSTVYDEIMRVPLLIATPRGRPLVVDEPVSLLDVGPTVLDLFGRGTPGPFLGESLVPLLAGRPASFSRPVVAESGRHLEMMLFADGRKAIHDRRRGFAELYDLRTDPAELSNLHDELGPVGATYVARLRAFRAIHRLERPGYEPPFRPP